MNPRFNLVDEKWIPCVLIGNEPPEDFSLRDVMLRAPELQEVRDDSPLTTVALLRLLLAIVYCMSGVRTRQEWHRLWLSLQEKNRFPKNMIEEYLDRQDIYGRFNLFDDHAPFFQEPKLAILPSNPKEDPTSPVTRLVLEQASGSNTTLFDHTYDHQVHAVSSAVAARWLVCGQTFATSSSNIGRGSIAEVNSPYTAGNSSGCFGGMTVWLQGRTLFETLLLNLIPVDLPDTDRPPWELPISKDGHAAVARINDCISHGIVDLLTWQNRMIKLLPDDDSPSPTVSRILYTQGRPPDRSEIPAFDPMKAYARTETKQGLKFIAVELGREPAAWGDYHALLSLGKGEAHKRPAMFSHVARMSGQAQLAIAARVYLHVTGTVGAQAKVNLWRHDRMPVAPKLLDDVQVVEHLGEAKNLMTQMSQRLDERVARLALLYLHPETGDSTPEERLHLANDMSRLAFLIALPEDHQKPRSGEKEALDLMKSLGYRQRFWGSCESPFRMLIDQLFTDPEGATLRWNEAITHLAEYSYREASQALGTSSRALRAVARVNPYFGVKDAAKEVTS